MDFHINSLLKEELLDEVVAEQAEDRTGQHPSTTDLISCLTKNYYKYLSRKDDDSNWPGLNTQTKIYYLVGLGLERALLTGRRSYDSSDGLQPDGSSPGEANNQSGQVDGIWYHVDLFADNHLLELKSTRASKKKFDQGDFPIMHIRQMMTYCVAKGVTEIDYAVLFLIPGEFEVYHITFSQEELDQHWAWMLSRKTVWDKAVETEAEPTPFVYNEPWECSLGGGCEYKLMCTLKSSMELRVVK